MSAISRQLSPGVLLRQTETLFLGHHPRVLKPWSITKAVTQNSSESAVVDTLPLFILIFVKFADSPVMLRPDSTLASRSSAAPDKNSNSPNLVVVIY